MSLDKQLTEVFAFFQDKDKNVVSVDDIPVIMRTLGVVPTESEMKKTVAAMMGDESCDTVHLGAFLTVAKKVLVDRRFLASSKDELSRALAVLANEGRTHLQEMLPPQDARSMYNESKKTVLIPRSSLSRDDLVLLLTSEGEPLTKEEAEEMVLTVPVKDGILVDLDLYATQLCAFPKFP